MNFLIDKYIVDQKFIYNIDVICDGYSWVIQINFYLEIFAYLTISFIFLPNSYKWPHNVAIYPFLFYCFLHFLWVHITSFRIFSRFMFKCLKLLEDLDFI